MTIITVAEWLNPYYLLGLTLLIFMFIIHWLFLKHSPKSQGWWKAVDYLWLFVSIGTIFILVAANIKNEKQEKIESAKNSLNAASKNLFSVLHQATLQNCTVPNRNALTMSNDGCNWIMKVSEAFPYQVGYSPLSEDYLLKLNSGKNTFALYGPAKSFSDDYQRNYTELKQAELALKSSITEKVVFAFWPFFVGFLLAVRISKVTADVITEFGKDERYKNHRFLNSEKMPVWPGFKGLIFILGELLNWAGIKRMIPEKKRSNSSSCSTVDEAAHNTSISSTAAKVPAQDVTLDLANSAVASKPPIK
jgi:hypothetical protein